MEGAGEEFIISQLPDLTTRRYGSTGFCIPGRSLLIVITFFPRIARRFPQGRYNTFHLASDDA